MAIAGGVTVAYVCLLREGEFVNLMATSTLRNNCATVDEATRILQTGGRAIVAGSDMAALRAAVGRVAVESDSDDGPASLNEVVNEHWPEDWGV